HLTQRWLYEAFLRTRRDGATGVDGQTAADFEANLPGNLASLREAAKSGTYRAPPVRRVYIPKGTGPETRPLGIPTFADKVLQRGVLVDGAIAVPEAGTPQGGVISPLLANVYLHYVLDVWFEREVKPRLRGRAFLIRYADDFVIGFACEKDARRVLEVLPKRFGKYGLTLHPDKTRLVPFQRPAPQPPSNSSERGRRSGTFDLLGFTHYWGRSRKGVWVVKRKTAQGRLSRALKRIAQWCRLNRHQPLAEQH